MGNLCPFMSTPKEFVECGEKCVLYTGRVSKCIINEIYDELSSITSNTSDCSYISGMSSDVDSILRKLNKD